MATPLMFTFLFLMLFHAADDDFATNSVDESSSSSTWPHCPSDAATPVDATPSIGRSSSGSSLVGSILDDYGKDILRSANDQSLDLAVGMRLQTIGARGLAKLLAEARRLGYQKMDIIDEESDRPVYGAGSPSKPNAIATPKPLGTVAGQYCPLSTHSPQPPSLEESRAPKRTNTVKVRRDESLLMNAHLSMLPMSTRLLLPRKKVANLIWAMRRP